MPWVWLFIQTFNNSWKPFNSIFNSKWNPNYSFKKELFINKKWNYSFSENIYSIENWIIAHGYFQGGPSYILWQVGHMVMLAHRLDTNQVCIKDIIDQNRGHWKGRHIFFFIKISWLRLHCVTGWLYWSKLSGYHNVVILRQYLVNDNACTVSVTIIKVNRKLFFCCFWERFVFFVRNTSSFDLFGLKFPVEAETPGPSVQVCTSW